MTIVQRAVVEERPSFVDTRERRLGAPEVNRARLAAKGYALSTFVSPNVEGVAKDHNLRVFDQYTRRWYERAPEPVIP